MITYEFLLIRLQERADEKYREFHKKLLKNERVNVFGVRTPVLRGFAKEYRGEFDALMTFPDDYYEVTFLKCACAALLPYGEFIKYVDRLVSLLDNWATCDCFVASCIRKHREDFLPYIEKYFSDGREYVRRYSLVTLLHDYMEETYLPLIFSYLRRCGEEEYFYVMMAAAWLLAEVLVKFYEAGIAFLQEGSIPNRIRNKAIQKARESFRLTEEQKNELLLYKSGKRVDKK